MALFLSDPDREEYSDDEMDEMLQGDDGDDEDMAQVMASVHTQITAHLDLISHCKTTSGAD